MHSLILDEQVNQVIATEFPYLLRSDSNKNPEHVLIYSGLQYYFYGVTREGVPVLRQYRIWIVAASQKFMVYTREIHVPYSNLIYHGFWF